MSTFYNLGLIGYPLGHSLSPSLHSAALEGVALQGRYDTYPITPSNDGKNLQAIMNMVREGEIQGLNVTIPHKQSVIPMLDQLTPVAKRVGAVNTVYCEDGLIIGDNTDVQGFLTDLKHCYQGDPSTALILGAGGSAHAITTALLNDGWKISIAARRPEQVEALLAHIHQVDPSGAAQSDSIPYSLAALERCVRRCKLLVNSTPVGMYPHVDVSPWFEELLMPSELMVYDLVYNPAETAFVRFSRECGAKGATGLGMLVEQAALSFEAWTGVAPDRNTMFAAGSDHLARNYKME
jgi:shikimate dehydrogenase